MKLIRTKKSNEKKVDQLLSYKRKLIKDDKNLVKRQLSELDVALGTIQYLEKIFLRHHLKMLLQRKLNNSGMKVDTTKTTGDGGIDLEGS